MQRVRLQAMNNPGVAQEAADDSMLRKILLGVFCFILVVLV